jgi:hypothetical protein
MRDNDRVRRAMSEASAYADRCAVGFFVAASIFIIVPLWVMGHVDVSLKWMLVVGFFGTSFISAAAVLAALRRLNEGRIDLEETCLEIERKLAELIAKI